MTKRYFEDFSIGQTYRSDSRAVDREAIVAFAGAFDPQPFHLSEEGGRASMFGALVASGWHTAALTMRLLVESDFNPAGGNIGAGVEELRWPRPVLPGDSLRIESEVLETRAMKSRPELGLVKLRTTTLNQNSEPVQVFVANVVVPKRPASRL